jgi:hypothetical protein
MKTKITKLVLEVGGKKLEFTPEEAKELKGILSDLFGGDKTVYVDRWHGYWPHYTPTYYPATPFYCSSGNIQGTISATGSASTYAGTAWTGSMQGTTANFCALTN